MLQLLLGPGELSLGICILRIKLKNLLEHLDGDFVLVKLHEGSTFQEVSLDVLGFGLDDLVAVLDGLVVELLRVPGLLDLADCEVCQVDELEGGKGS